MATTTVPVETQVAAARGQTLLVARADLAAFAVRGGDRVSWLNGLLTCDLAKLPVGGAAYGLATTQKGRILADVVVLAEPERVLVVAPGGPPLAELVAAFDHYLVMEDAVMDASEPFAVWEAIGPSSDAIVRAAAAAGASAAAVDRTGLGGAVVIAPASRRDEVGRALGDAASAAGGAEGDDAGYEALRLELGVPRFGKDFDKSTYPQEAGLEKRAVSFQKGCYLGQEVVCMLELRGHVKRRLASLAIEGDAPPAPGAEITDAAGAKVGEVTSAIVSPLSHAPIAIGMVKAALLESGGELRVGGARAVVRRATS